MEVPFGSAMRILSTFGTTQLRSLRGRDAVGSAVLRVFHVVHGVGLEWARRRSSFLSIEMRFRDNKGVR